MIAKVRGQFSRWSGTLQVPADRDFTRATLDVVIDASSIDTGVADRDAHLKSADFFDVEKYPELTFTSTGVERAGDAALKVNPDSPAEIGHALRKLITDTDFAASLGAEARRRFDRCFTWPAVARRYDGLYKEIAPEVAGACGRKTPGDCSGRF